MQLLASVTKKVELRTSLAYILTVWTSYFAYSYVSCVLEQYDRVVGFNIDDKKISIVALEFTV